MAVGFALNMHALQAAQDLAAVLLDLQRQHQEVQDELLSDLRFAAVSPCCCPMPLPNAVQHTGTLLVV